ncbi:hypothetical protein [Streptacidiphilus sp. EB103A]|uniref:hypothetical protein n=1 Tax=Streptacidiphilus sp. EB103A TaxID=3156275 RepID=UPI003518A961
MNPHTVGGGAGQDGRPSHDTESPTLAFIPPPDLADRRAGGASTELALFASSHTKELEPAAHPAGGSESSADGSSRAGTVIAGELRLAVNAPDGSSATVCPQDQRPEPVPAPVDATIRPRTVSGLLERDALCERLRGQLLQGRSVRLIGAPGSGRSAILEAVAGACSGLAPAGVIQLSGCFRTPADLLQDLFAAAYDAPGYRPGRALAPGIMHDLCAIVVIDDVEFGGEALEELIAAAPESSFLLSSTPAAAAPVGDGGENRRLEDSRLPGLSRQSSLALLARLAGRSLDETERAWAVDLWFESEGLPLRFVQAAALLRHRETAIEAMAAFAPDEDGPGTLPQLTPGSFEAYLRQHGGAEVGAAADAADEPVLPDPVPLPSVAESAAPAVRIARGLSTGGRRTLLLAAALGGVCPSAPHLPALIDVGHGETAIEELVAAGLAARVGAHHRLVDGVADLVAAEWPVETALRTAAQHFAWWTGHASVTERQIADEAEVLLATMHADREAGRHGQVVLLARACAPSFALALRWGAWERALRFGLESARATAGVAEEAWFHHELGVLALCVGAHDRSRAELEASVALRGALGDARGTAAGRAALRQLDAAAARQGSRTVVVGGRGSSGMTGLRRVLPLLRPLPRPGLLRQVQQRQSFADHSVSRRQIVLATVAVVLMGALGAAAAYGIGAFRQAGASTGTLNQNVNTTAPQSSGPTDPAGVPAASSSSAASTSSSASSSTSATGRATSGATVNSGSSPGTGASGGSTGGSSGQSSSSSSPAQSSDPTSHSASPSLSPSTPVSPTPSASASKSASSSASVSASPSASPTVTTGTTGATSTTVVAAGPASSSATS